MRRAATRDLGRLLARYRSVLAVSFALSILQSVLLLPVALIVRHVFDSLVPHHRVGAVVWSGVAIMALYLASAALALWSRYGALKVTKVALTDLRRRVLAQALSFPKAYIDKTRAGELHSSIIWDSERVDLMASALIVALSSTTVAVGLSLVLLVLNWLLFLGLVCVVPVLMAVSRLLGRRVRGRTRVWQEALDRFSSQTQLALRTMTLMKVHAAESVELAKRDQEIEELSEAGLRMSWLQTAYALVEGTVAASAGVVVLIVGGVAVTQGSMTVGELLSFYAVLALLLRQANTILTAVPIVMSGDEALRRLEELLDAKPPEPYRGGSKITFGGAVAIEHVSFGYDEEQLLDHVTMAIEPGQRVALIGPNGAGKSTMLSLILGLYRPRSGRLMADGIPYDELDVQALRRQMGVVLQDPVIFPATVRENIAYGSPSATDEDIRRAAEWATADFIDALPAGLDTDVGDEGELLSGGQRQRIAIARALLASPVLLILDEPTTNLDDSAVMHLMENLRTLPYEPAMLLITHDPEVARSVDTVHELRDGRIVAGKDSAKLVARLGVGRASSA